MAKVYAVFFESVIDYAYDESHDVFLEDIYADEKSAKEAVKHRIQQRLEYIRNRKECSIVESSEMGLCENQKGYRIDEDEYRWSGYFYQEYELMGGEKS